ncbi:hypothetical protein [Streptomyces sp. 8K308]|uniref:hypothetical protein n=1 Tax=Streptomyces sp. 8K308 TaxID=2530388 RepID=UPI001A9DB685|nr:hypothetical protein [Streptomyces sp. 8K308]
MSTQDMGIAVVLQLSGQAVGGHPTQGVAGHAEAGLGVDVAGQRAAALVRREGLGEDLGDVPGGVAAIDVVEVVLEVRAGDDEAGRGQGPDDGLRVLRAAANAG